MSSHERNIQGLRQHADYKRNITITKVEKAIQALISTNKTINFNVVSNEAGVSKSYLYKNTLIRERIERLRLNRVQKVTNTNMIDGKQSMGSKERVIAAKDSQIKKLSSENLKLKEELQNLRGKLYDRIQ